MRLSVKDAEVESEHNEHKPDECRIHPPIFAKWKQCHNKKRKDLLHAGPMPAAEGLDIFFGVPVAYKRRVDDIAKPKKGYLLPF